MNKIGYSFDQSFQQWKASFAPSTSCSCGAACDHMHEPSCPVAESFCLWKSLGVDKNTTFDWSKPEETAAATS